MPKSLVFALRPNEEGLSVFHANIVTPRGVLQAFIDNNTANLNAEDDSICERALKSYKIYPTVETMVEEGWRIVKIPISAIIKLGFSLTEVESNGHLEIRGERELFKQCELAFVELVKKGTAQLLTKEECRAL